MDTRPIKKYPMVTILVFLLVGFGTFISIIRPLLPLRHPNALINNPGELVKNAARQEIKWFSSSLEACSIAKKENKPILLMLGSMADTASRYADEEIFSNWDIIERLKKHFICLRIDLYQHPEKNTAFLPIARSHIGFETGLQFWVISSEGNPISSTMRLYGDPFTNNFTMNSFLKQSYEDFKDYVKKRQQTAIAKIHKKDLDLFSLQKKEQINFNEHLYMLQQQIDRQNGGLPVYNAQILYVYPWHYMMMQRDTINLIESLLPVLQKGIVDWLDGGFFNVSESKDWSRILFDKSAIHNAEMACLLSHLWCQPSQISIIERNYCRQIALETFDMLSRDMWIENSFCAYRAGDQDVLWRSKRSTITNRFLNEHIDWQYRDWINDRFNLESPQNPQKLIQIINPAKFLNEKANINMQINKLRELRPKVPKQNYGGKGLCYINGFVIAKMLESARLLGDETRLIKAKEYFLQIKTDMRSANNQMFHSKITGENSQYLGDPLAYSDAALQYYLVSGDLTVLQDGFQVLQKALSLYHSNKYGLLLNTPFKQKRIPFQNDIPNLTDDIHESLMSTAIRLMFVYGSLQKIGIIKTKQKPYFDDLIKMSQNYVNKLAPILNNMKYFTSSIYCSALLLHNQTCLLVTTKNALADSYRLSQKLPSQIIIPVIKSEFKKGYHLIHNGVSHQVPLNVLHRMFNVLQ